MLAENLDSKFGIRNNKYHSSPFVTQLDQGNPGCSWFQQIPTQYATSMDESLKMNAEENYSESFGYFYVLCKRSGLHNVSCAEWNCSRLGRPIRSHNGKTKTITWLRSIVGGCCRHIKGEQHGLGHPQQRVVPQWT